MSKFKHLAWKPYLAVAGLALSVGWFAAIYLYDLFTGTAEQLANMGF